MPTAPFIASIQIGPVQDYGPTSEPGRAGQPWKSAIAKTTVSGPVLLTGSGLTGDAQADLVHHGGRDKAVLGYAAAHYAAWKTELPAAPFSPGAFGENLTLVGLDETQVCVGDLFEIGNCRLEVSQPRQPCWKLARRWNLPELTALVLRTGRTGWYHRVLATGELSAGTRVVLVERPFPQLTIAYCNQVMHGKPRNAAADLALASCPALAPAWREALTERVRQAES